MAAAGTKIWMDPSRVRCRPLATGGCYCCWRLLLPLLPLLTLTLTLTLLLTLLLQAAQRRSGVL